MLNKRTAKYHLGFTMDLDLVLPQKSLFLCLCGNFELFICFYLFLFCYE